MPEMSQIHYASMHVYFEKLAKALNDSGHDVVRFINLADNKLKLPWTKDIVKELWRIVQKCQTNKESTLEISPYEAIQIYEIFGQRVAELTGVSIEWPCDNGMVEKEFKV